MPTDDPKISVVMPVKIDHDWQIPMTTCAIQTIAVTTDVPADLIIVEAGNRFRENQALHRAHPSLSNGDNFLTFDPPTGNASKEVNAGVDLAAERGADFVVYIGNDVFVRPGWLEALLACFEIEDCGAATLLASELKNLKGGPKIIEGCYGPLMMLRPSWRFDEETFPGTWADTDLMMRMYVAGLRSYRNHSVVIEHLNQQTAPVSPEAHAAAKQRFIEKHEATASQLRMYWYFVGGQII